MMEEEELGEEGEEDADGVANGGRKDGVVEIGAPGDGASGEAVKPADRITTPYMTRFERARVLGTRALQIRCRPCPARPPVRTLLHFSCDRTHDSASPPLPLSRASAA